MEKIKMEKEVKENKIKNLNNYQLEIQNIAKHKAELLVKLDLFKKKRALQEKNYNVIINNFEYLKPSWKYETVPEYIENIKQLNILSMEENRMMWNTTENNLLQGINTADIQTEDLKKATAIIEKEIEEDDRE